MGAGKVLVAALVLALCTDCTCSDGSDAPVYSMGYIWRNTPDQLNSYPSWLGRSMSPLALVVRKVASGLIQPCGIVLGSRGLRSGTFISRACWVWIDAECGA